MNLEDIKTYFLKKGFKIEDDTLDPAFYFRTEKLRVGVFAPAYPNDGYCGCILAEHIDNFDKWSKAFYTCTWPQAYIDYRDYNPLDIVLKDLEYISDDFNTFLGNSFGTLQRIL